MKTGVDIVKNIRIKKILNKNRESFYRRIFTQKEIEYIEDKDHDYKTVAALFASKEAISKLIGCGIGQLGWKDIEIGHTELGKPYVVLNKILQAKLCLEKINSIDISLSHEEEYSIAFAIGYLSPIDIDIPKEMKVLLPPRNVDSHKGTYGRVGIIGGSKGMTGAPFLASTAALKSGSGLVYSIVTKDIEDIMAIKLTEVIVKSYEDIKDCMLYIKNLDGVVLGPGLGQDKKKKSLVIEVLNNYKGPIVLDADGINAIEQDFIIGRKGITVITPHPGELATLLGKDIKEIQDNRIYYSKYASDKYNVITVLKGHNTIVNYKERLYINHSGNPGMATAGSGDILAGMIISFICQGIEPFDACTLAVYAHGLSGDLASDKKGEYGLIASDILACIPFAIKRIQS